MQLSIRRADRLQEGNSGIIWGAHSPRRDRVPPSPVATADFTPPSEGAARLAGIDSDCAVLDGLRLWHDGEMVFSSTITLRFASFDTNKLKSNFGYESSLMLRQSFVCKVTFK